MLALFAARTSLYYQLESQSSVRLRLSIGVVETAHTVSHATQLFFSMPICFPFALEPSLLLILFYFLLRLILSNTLVKLGKAGADARPSGCTALCCHFF